MTTGWGSLGGRSRETILPGSEIVLPPDATDTEFDPPLRYFQVSVAGTLVVDTPNSENKTIPAAALVAGVQYVGFIRKIYATSTATGVVGWR